MTNPEQDIARFLRRVEGAELPIDPEDVILFAQAVQAFSPPDGWIGRVLSSLQYIDKSTFERDLKRMASQAISVIGDQPYVVVLTQKGKSDYWIYEQLQRKGIPRAHYEWDDAAKAIMEHNKLINEKIAAVSRDLPDDKIAAAYHEIFRRFPYPIDVQAENTDLPICVFDDFSLSGSMVADEILMESMKKPSKTHVFVCYVSSVAKSRFDKEKVTLHPSGQSIKLLSSTLTAADMNFLLKLDELTVDSGGFSDAATLFWTWYKIPDNVPDVFLGTVLPPLIRKERFNSPYIGNSNP